MATDFEDVHQVNWIWDTLMIEAYDSEGHVDEQSKLNETNSFPNNVNTPALHHVGQDVRHRPKQKQSRFTEQQNAVLEDWLVAHILYPYPETADLESLATATHLSVHQVRLWFARTRQRKLQHVDSSLAQSKDCILTDPGSANDVSFGPVQKSTTAVSSPNRTTRNLSTGPPGSSLLVAPASPHLTECEGAREGLVWDAIIDARVSDHGVSQSLHSCSTASKIQWWLMTLPESQTQYHRCPTPPDITDDVCERGSESEANLSELVYVSGHKHIPHKPQEDRGNTYQNCSATPMSVVPIAPSLVPTDDGQMNPPPCRPIGKFRPNDYHPTFSSNEFANRSSTSVDRMSVGSAVTRTSSQARRGRKGCRRSYRPQHVQREQGTLSRVVQYHSLKTSRAKASYFCTFCRERFQDRYRWQRHEEASHAPQIAWICRPKRPESCHMCQFLAWDPVKDPCQHRMQTCWSCPLCRTLDWHNPQDPCQHRMETCWSRPEAERTFYRKDNLVQHLKGVHHGGQLSQGAAVQLRALIRDAKYDLTCCFCGHKRSTWSKRMDHIAAHFEESKFTSPVETFSATKSSYEQPSELSNIGLNTTNVQQPQSANFASEIFETNFPDPQQPSSPSLSLTYEGLGLFSQTYDDSGSYAAEWLAIHRREVDENPAHYFLEHSVAFEMDTFDDEPMFNMELEGSMIVDDSDAPESYQDSYSAATSSHSCSSLAASQTRMENRRVAGFVSRPLPLLDALKERTCPRCRTEHGQ